MPLTWKDRIKVSIASGGTGTLTLNAAASGYQTFAAGDDGKLFPYVIENGTAWETGYGTYTHAGTTFARTSRTASSSGSAIDAGTGYLYVDLVSNNSDNMNLAAQAILPGGRLTLESGVPVSTSDQTAKTNIYYTPYIHNIICLWDGNIWKSVEFSEVTQALGTLTSGKPYDVFGYLSSGVLATEMLAWTDDTTRATSVTLQDGRYCKNGDKTRLYLGTFYTTATTTTEDSEANRYVYNFYNRENRRAKKGNSTTHQYTTASWREWNNVTTNRINFVDGVPSSGGLMVFPTEFALNMTTSGSATYIGFCSLAINSTTSPSLGTNIAANVMDTIYACYAYVGKSISGKNYITVLEYGSGAGTNTDYDSFTLTASLRM